MKNEKFGCFICQLRKEKSMSQQELADLIPIGREAISKWERGKTIPDYDSMIKLSEIFNLSASSCCVKPNSFILFLMFFPKFL